MTRGELFQTIAKLPPDAQLMVANFVKFLGKHYDDKSADGA